MSKEKEKLQESLSALMDDEASEFEFRRILKECAVNDNLKHKWERFHFLSAAIKGELDYSIDNKNEKSPSAHLKQPDLLTRINTELDGVHGSASKSPSLNNLKSDHSLNNNQTVNLKRLGQGAIAASVAALVLIAGGSFKPAAPFDAEMQIAGQAENLEDSVPEFNDAYSPSEFSLVPQLYTEFTGTESQDEAARVRLRQAVFQEFVGETQESAEFPVNFSVTIEAE